MSGVRKYDWDAFMDGKYHVMIQGVDMRATPVSLRVQLAREAMKRGLHARTFLVRGSVSSFFHGEQDALVFRVVEDPHAEAYLEDALASGEVNERIRPHFVESLERAGLIPAA